MFFCFYQQLVDRLPLSPPDDDTQNNQRTNSRNYTNQSDVIHVSLLCFAFWPPIQSAATKIALLSKRRHKLMNQRDDGGPQNHHHESGKDKEDQRWHHFYRGLCTHLFGALPAADAHVV
jgi:hypothetical protein